ncbi:hypothetical protein [Phytobacter massiliensis]|uniref:hypothetical protein n=1 Tax=Phytobacter massiliensis TaxID=1485952 RepID=UPI000310A100|nr:hypothetical protein [Phytobacter massiliensis]
MKRIFFTTLLALTSLNVSALPSMKTSIDVQAEISTSVRIYVEGNDVTNGAITLKLEEKNGYMTGTTPELLFIGNASSVSVSLTSPATKGLVSENGDQMRINTAWIKPGDRDISTSYPVNNLPVYPTLQDATKDTSIRVRFTSADRSETYPLGLYSGTYEIMVTPSI